MRADPLAATAEERSFFHPIGADELTDRMGTCIRRDLKSADETEAVTRSREAEALDFCARVEALHPFSKADDCALSVQLVWGDVRHGAGPAVVDALYEKAFAGDEAARSAAEAFTEEDDVWRGTVANSCLGNMETSERVACKTALQRDRGVAYYTRLMEMTGGL